MKLFVFFLVLVFGAATPVRAGYQIGVVDFTATEVDPYLGAGLSEMIVTDLVQLTYAGKKFGACDVSIIELKRRADILKELELQRSNLVDPATRVQQGKLLNADYVVEGSVRPDGAGGLAWAVQMREAAIGRIVAGDRSSSKLGGLIDESPRIAERLLDQICTTRYQVVIETTAEGVHTDRANCTQPIILDVKATIPVRRVMDASGKMALEGSAPHIVSRYTHSLRCTSRDRASPNSAVSERPMRVRLVPPRAADDKAAPANDLKFALLLDPGRIKMTWTLHSFGATVVSYPWWEEMIAAHLKARAQGKEFLFDVRSASAGTAIGDFTSSGSYSDITGTWKGTEKTRITITPAAGAAPLPAASSR